MTLQTLIWLCGLHSLAFGAFHLAFWKLFDWPRSLQSTTLANRAIIQILNLRLTWVFAAMGAALLAWPAEVAGTRLGHALLGFLCAFWIGRTVEQVVFLRVDRLMVHGLTLLFALGALLAGIAWWQAAFAG